MVAGWQRVMSIERAARLFQRTVRCERVPLRPLRSLRVMSYLNVSHGATSVPKE